ncbi:hypothetical protein SKAU_G00167130 [Synaphobranchus kaupii]|uniref:Uncharacterized protein n=1 Tax=Synaphobranchus kaupii TaxID=118154 RepID=A0A9Q1FJN2_SYNKA|nr:hypothetical protein SKAU_G00167130 [Synaphobranchus kaupii]
MKESLEHRSGCAGEAPASVPHQTPPRNGAPITPSGGGDRGTDGGDRRGEVESRRKPRRAGKLAAGKNGRCEASGTKRKDCHSNWERAAVTERKGAKSQPNRAFSKLPCSVPPTQSAAEGGLRLAGREAGTEGEGLVLWAGTVYLPARAHRAGGPADLSSL